MGDSDTRQSMFGRLRDDPHDPATWKEIVARYGGRIFAWASGRGLPGADCEDVTQQVLLRLAGVLRTFEYDQGKGRFRDYLRRMTQTAVVDYVRKARRSPSTGAGVPIPWTRSRRGPTSFGGSKRSTTWSCSRSPAGV